MSSAERLATLFADLTARGVPCLVLGGHAVRYYGVDRNTVDYDFHVALERADWDRLPERLTGSTLVTDFAEAPSWRPTDFRRFVIGKLPDGRDELLECWRRNHLLAPFPELQARREEGSYGGGQVAFLGLDDLIRSKQTEHESDWADIALLEEIADMRAIARAQGPEGRANALASLRSRRGFEEMVRRGWLGNAGLVTAALARARSALALAYLAPWVPGGAAVPRTDAPAAVLELLEGPLRSVAPGSARHLALVEAVRRLHKRAAMEADRADKESARP